MGRVLLLTVGGSCEPLVTSIKQLKPDYVYFICSSDQKTPQKTKGSYVQVDGEGKPCFTRDGQMPSVVAQTGLQEDQYEKILIPNIDSLTDCYAFSAEAIFKGRERFKGDVLVDYTGGTKTMSAGLVAAALDDGEVKMYLTGGERLDLKQVRSGSQRVIKCNWTPLIVRRHFSTIENLFRSFDYEGCLEFIHEISPDIEIGTEEDTMLQRYHSICKGFLAWDIFDHEGALPYIETYARDLIEYKIFLDNVLRQRQRFIDRAKGSHKEDESKKRYSSVFYLVHDLLRNAERRLIQRRFDDAVARVYRSSELLAQSALIENKPSINTGDVDLLLLPEDIRDRYASESKNGGGKVQIGLFMSYQLLSDLKHPLGLLMDERRNRMKDLILTRNSSILAHGIEPVEERRAREFFGFVVDLIESYEEMVEIKKGFSRSPQFPRELNG